jgi:hypothetical protein
LKSQLNTMLLSPADILKRGLHFLQMQVTNKWSQERKQGEFHKHYGSSPLTLANIWYDLTTTDIAEARLSGKENTERGFRMFLLTNFFLWTYPKNSHLLSSRFHICEHYCRGEHVWIWIQWIAAMKKKKIVWDP